MATSQYSAWSTSCVTKAVSQCVITWRRAVLYWEWWVLLCIMHTFQRENETISGLRFVEDCSKLLIRLCRVVTRRRHWKCELHRRTPSGLLAVEPAIAWILLAHCTKTSRYSSVIKWYVAGSLMDDTTVTFSNTKPVTPIGIDTSLFSNSVLRKWR